MPRECYIGSRTTRRVTVGGVHVPVAGGIAGGGDMVRCRPRRDHLEQDLIRARNAGALPVLADLASCPDIPAVTPYADGLIAYTGDVQATLPDAERRGLPVVLVRDPDTSPTEWLEIALRWRAGSAGVILCEGGGRPRRAADADPTGDPCATPDLALLRKARERTDAPVMVDVSAAPELAAAAVVGGADGILLAEDAGVREAGAAVELATTLAPFGHHVAPATLAHARSAIDQVDACLANLLERRAELAGLVQRFKPVGGFAGRDPDRERELVAAMVDRAPRLGLARMHRIMAVVIQAGLDLAETEESTGGGEAGGAGAPSRQRHAGPTSGVRGTAERRAGKPGRLTRDTP